MADQSRPVNPRMHYLILTVTSSGCPKLYLKSMQIENGPINSFIILWLLKYKYIIIQELLYIQ